MTLLNRMASQSQLSGSAVDNDVASFVSGRNEIEGAFKAMLFVSKVEKDKFVLYLRDQWWPSLLAAYTTSSQGDSWDCTLCYKGHVMDSPCIIYQKTDFDRKMWNISKGSEPTLKMKGKKVQKNDPGFIQVRVGGRQVYIAELAADAGCSDLSTRIMEQYGKTVSHDVRVALTSVPWLWKYSWEQLEQITRITSSHACMQGLTTGRKRVREEQVVSFCINPDHIDPLGLTDNQGLNDCSPCVCSHFPQCKVPGFNFRRRMEGYSPQQLADIRQRLRISEPLVTHTLP